MNSNLVSAIIGFWRMGATMEEIKETTNVPPFYITEIINKHTEILSCKEMINILETASNKNKK